MSSYREPAHRAAAERMIQFAQSNEVRPTLREYSQFLKTDKGRHVWHELAVLSDDLLSDVLKISEYDLRVTLLAIESEIPLMKFSIIARLSVEFHRCVFFGVGEIPICDVAPRQEENGA